MKHWASTPAGRERLSDMQRKRWAKLKDSDAPQPPIQVATHLVIAIHGHELKLTTAEARELHQLLTPHVSAPPADAERNADWNVKQAAI